MSFSIGGNEWYNSSNSTLSITSSFNANSDGLTPTVITSTDNVVYTGASEGIRIISEGLDACDNGNPCMVLSKTSSYSSGLFTVWHYNGTATGSISYDGATISYNTSSDYRLKDNINPMTKQWNLFQYLNPVTFTYKNDTSNNSIMGFIAHEVANTYSDIVNGEKDAVDEYGAPDYQGIDYGRLTPYMIKVLQEMMEKIETLENDLSQKIQRIETLEGV